MCEAEARRRVDVDVKAIVGLEVEIEWIVGNGLRESARAAWPLLAVEDLGGDGRVGGVVGIVTVRVGWFDSENGVEEDALEVVGITRVGGSWSEADEVTGELGGGVSTARRLEVIDRGGERVVAARRGAV